MADQNVWQKRDNAYNQAHTENQKPEGKGCCFYGCISAAVLSVLLVIVAFVAVNMGFKWLVNNWTSPSAQELPPAAVLSAEGMQDLNTRYEAFLRAVADGLAGKIELTSDEINALIATRDELAQARGVVYFNIKDDQLSGSVSIPLDDVGFKALKGRFFNGTGSFKVWTRNGRVFLILSDIDVQGKKLPKEALDGLAAKNLLDKTYQQPDKAKALERFEKVEVAGGKLIIELAAAPAGATGQ